MSLKELVAMLLGIKIIDGEVVAIMIITSSMIYLANADQLHNNNIKTTTLHLQLIDMTRFARHGSRNSAR